MALSNRTKRYCNSSNSNYSNSNSSNSNSSNPKSSNPNSSNSNSSNSNSRNPNSSNPNSSNSNSSNSSSSNSSSSNPNSSNSNSSNSNSSNSNSSNPNSSNSNSSNSNSSNSSSSNQQEKNNGITSWNGSMTTKQNNVYFLFEMSLSHKPEGVFNEQEKDLAEFKFPPTPTTMSDKLKLVGRGENIQAGEQQVHITTAVYYKDYPLKPGFNVFLNGWARHNDSMDFKCCFFSSLPEADSQGVMVTEVAARMYNVYRQWIVDMQNAEFSCSVPTAANATLQFRYVTFVKLTCRDIKDKVMRIEMPEVIPKSVGVCLKVTYGKVNPEKMVEWFEFMKLMKVTRVFTYYFDVEPEHLVAGPGLKSNYTSEMTKLLHVGKTESTTSLAVFCNLTHVEWYCTSISHNIEMRHYLLATGQTRSFLEMA
uniref:Uncharacterized protein n=1 Tax=Biomphalaria glabrata TaxID=6526 RepID=A0A2C9K8Y7_BIOGL